MMHIERDPARPGWLVVVIQRRAKTRRIWLAQDEAAQLLALLAKEIPPVTTTRTGTAGRLRTCSLVTDLHR
jgi:hypothetical protein